MLSVNVSGVQLKNVAELEREVEESLSHWNIDPDDIELELTESVLMEATQRHSNTAGDGAKGRRVVAGRTA